MDISDLAVDLGPNGLDPLIEKQADEYGRRAWQLDFVPVLNKVLGDEFTEELQVALQEAIFEHKYTILKDSKIKKVNNKKLGKRW